MRDKASRIIFYGSLMSAFNTLSRLGIREQLELLGPCSIPGRLYDLGEYPALLPARQEQDTVRAELHAIKGREVLEVLDAFEDYQPGNNTASLYIRQAVRPDAGGQTAWVYIYNKPVVESDFIACGCWMQHLRQKMQ
jgi:gamma-glutamylcyclotransferase (GGCT)/AIG2-like uncharacterized protein YtfP